MAQIHGKWGHYVRPGKTDGTRYGGDSRHEHVRGPESVFDNKGRHLYTCPENGARTLEYALRKRLPAGSLRIAQGNMRITLPLEACGFTSRKTFKAWCEDVARNTSHESEARRTSTHTITRASGEWLHLDAHSPNDVARASKAGAEAFALDWSRMRAEGRNCELWRRATGLGVSELCKRAGLSVAGYVMFLTGEARLTDVQVRSMANACGITPSTLLRYRPRRRRAQ